MAKVRAEQYPALPEAVRLQYGRGEWEEQFETLGRYTREPNACWRGFGLDCCCAEGRSLHCLDVFGRQLICALNRLHPQAALAFAHREIAKAAWALRSVGIFAVLQHASCDLSSPMRQPDFTRCHAAAELAHP